MELYYKGMQKYAGDLYIASITVIQSMMQLIDNPISGFASGVQPIISFNFVAGNFDGIKKLIGR